MTAERIAELRALAEKGDARAMDVPIANQLNESPVLSDSDKIYPGLQIPATSTILQPPE